MTSKKQYRTYTAGDKLTLDKVIAIFENLTGRKVTEAEKATMIANWERYDDADPESPEPKEEG